MSGFNPMQAFPKGIKLCYFLHHNERREEANGPQGMRGNFLWCSTKIAALASSTVQAKQ